MVVLIATLATIAFNGISQSLPIGGRTSADVSNMYSTYFTPANYAFAIWGVIYLLLFAYSIYQALPSQRANPNARRIGWLYVLSCVLNCLWITLFQYDQILISLIVIVGLLLSLIGIYLRLNVGRASVSTADRWLLQLPFSVYVGWLSVATIANVAVLGAAQNWGDLFGIAAPTWAAIMLGSRDRRGFADGDHPPRRRLYRGLRLGFPRHRQQAVGGVGGDDHRVGCRHCAAGGISGKSLA